ncbi:MAG: enoyl-CoA hydratase [Xanthobacteraceae bacterium]|nr:MAG: enoyl-CoA hydratase [Xanthobacteraceae bacterium]
MSDLVIETSGPVTTFIRTRSAARNAMNPEGALALHEALVAFDADENASVGVLWGAGGAFCAGFDLKHAALAPGGTPFGGDLDIPDGPATVEAGDRRHCRTGGRRGHGDRALV